MTASRRSAAALFVCASWLAAGPGVIGRDTSFEMDPGRTHVEFTLSDVLHTVHGTFQLKRGNLRFDPESGKASGDLVVDAASGDSGSGARDRRMNSNILESASYPEIVFQPDRMEGKLAAQGDSDVSLHGIFRIHGADHEITVPVHVTAADGEYATTAHFSVPYVKWGMKNPSTLFLRVGEKVDILVKTVAKPIK